MVHVCMCFYHLIVILVPIEALLCSSIHFTRLFTSRDVCSCTNFILISYGNGIGDIGTSIHHIGRDLVYYGGREAQVKKLF